MSTTQKNMDRGPGPEVSRTRILQLLDTDSFVELGAFVGNAAVTTGYGAVDGRLVYVYSQEGPVNLPHAGKISQVYATAMKVGAPVVGILDSKGMQLRDGLDVFNAYGQILSAQSEASGVIPQISIVTGDCMGTASFMVGLSDFVFMTAQNTRLFLESPNTYTDGKTFTTAPNDEYHSCTTGLVDFCCETTEACMQKARELLRYIPSNNLGETADADCGDDLNRVDPSLNDFFYDETRTDMHTLLQSVFDEGQYIEAKPFYGKNVCTAFGRLAGYTAGVLTISGRFDPPALEKAAKFVNFCDAYNIPIVTLTDAAGYESSSSGDRQLLLNGAKIIHAFANATVPKVNVILRKGIGGAYLLFNSRHIGADIVYSWPTAEVAPMDGEAADKIMHAELDGSPLDVASRGYIDDIIEPSVTRKRILIALEMLATKRVARHSRKHSSVVL